MFPTWGCLIFKVLLNQKEHLIFRHTHISSPMTIPIVQDRLHAVGSTASKAFLGLTYKSLVICDHCPQPTRAKIVAWTWGCTPKWRMSWARWNNAMTNWQGTCPRLLLPRIQLMRSLPFSSSTDIKIVLQCPDQFILTILFTCCHLRTTRQSIQSEFVACTKLDVSMSALMQRARSLSQQKNLSTLDTVVIILEC